MECQDVYNPTRCSLKDHIHDMYQMWRDVGKKEADIRLELRKYRGHGGKVNDQVLDWLDRADRIKGQLFDAPTQPKLQVDLLKDVNVLSMVQEIQLLQSESQILVMDDFNVGPQNSDMSAPPLVGRYAQEVSNQIREYLMNPMVGSIGIYGEGGVGKTTIMTKISNQLTDTEIFDRVIWLKYKSLESLQEEIVALLVPKYWKDEKKSLFIIDDVLHQLDLRYLGIPRPKRGDGCKLVLITRSRHVAMGLGKMIHLVPLTANETWDLFVKRSGNQVLDPRIQNIASEMVHECRGLPVSIVTVAHAMRGEVNITVWREALTDLQNTQAKRGKQFQGDRKRVSDHLRFGYNRLKNDQVRECFIYCAFFPKGYKFEVKELLEYWFSENFLSSGEDILTSTNKGLEILKDLTDANMLELFLEGDGKWLRMQGLFRELAIDIMEVRDGIFPRAGLGLKQFPFNADYSAAEKISLIGNQMEQLDLNPSSFHLTTLLLKGNPLSHVPNSFLKQVHCLQVLDVSYSGITQLPESFSRLTKLRALFLKYCTSLTKIPSLECLKELQILNMCGTLIKELPHGIERLGGLRFLDLTDTLMLGSVQDGVISSLANIEELHMRGSRLCKLEKESVANCFKEIRCLGKLVILTLSVVGFEDHLETIVHLQGYRLKSFSINIYGSTQDYAEDL